MKLRKKVIGPDKRGIVYADGCSRGNPGPAAIGGVVQNHKGTIIGEVSAAIGRATNNVAEYRALIETLSVARRLGLQTVEIRLDSELVVKQIRGQYRTRKPDLKPLLARALDLLEEFQGYNIEHVPRSLNRRADALCNRALDRAGN
ncbi:MAG: ribonuclease HI family protein [Dehalococcoidia bacterium]